MRCGEAWPAAVLGVGRVLGGKGPPASGVDDLSAAAWASFMILAVARFTVFGFGTGHFPRLFVAAPETAPVPVRNSTDPRHRESNSNEQSIKPTAKSKTMRRVTNKIKSKVTNKTKSNKKNNKKEEGKTIKNKRN